MHTCNRAQPLESFNVGCLFSLPPPDARALAGLGWEQEKENYWRSVRLGGGRVMVAPDPPHRTHTYIQVLAVREGGREECEGLVRR